ncbi:MAG: hypothetical protein GWM88_11765 [Pseudomonadales bacterium]|nr:hypothetical protein [Pseudomonadales bacterium]NIX08634.1 hypothetical protein [Pseudomonadales bacterium]
MSVRLTKPWLPASALEKLTGQMGVYQLGDEAGDVIAIGYAGGRSTFGLRGAVATALERHPEASCYRVEVNSAYLSRYRELLMVHQADFGSLPPGNAAVPGLGRLSPS